MSDLNITVSSPLTQVVEVESSVNRIVEVGGSAGLNSSISSLSARIEQTGSYLAGQIVASSAGVSSLNSLSGNVTLAGKGNIFVSTGNGLINISGDTGIYASFITSSQTGGFGGSANTGALTGAFYPLNLNPASYLTGFNSGIYITTGQTGSFGGGGNTGVLTGIFYPLNSNPASYITGSVIRPSDTGQFYASSNPNNYITGFNSGLFTLDSETGNLADRTYVQNVSGAIDTRLNATGQSISSWTGTSTGIYYPYGSNPASYLTGFNSGIYITTGQTGSFGGGGNTGVLTGVFYPLTSNPSNYVTGNIIRPSDTGQFYASSNPNNYITGFNSGLFTLDSETGNLADKGYVGAVSGIIDTRLQTTGSTLIGLIQAASAGVSSLNSSSGILTLGGAGNVSVSTAGQTITVSGNTGAYSTFYLATNPSNYITNSGFLTGFINGPTGFNATGLASGIVNNQIQFYSLSGASGIFISNISGIGTVILSTTGLVYQSATGGFAVSSQITTITNWTGSTTGIFYPYSLNPANYVTGSVVRPTDTGSFITTSQTGQFYTSSNPNQYATSGNLLSTGSNLQSQVINITNWTGISSGIYYPYSSNPASYVTGSVIRPTDTGNFITTSQTGQFYSSNNPNNYISYAAVGGVQTINITGSLISGALTLTGAGITSITKSGQIITISGDVSSLATATNLASTGSTISTWTGLTPNLFAPFTHGHNYVTGISVTGSTSITGLVNLTGIGGLNIILSAQTISFSGGAGGGTTETASNLGAGSGVYSTKVGNDLQFKSLIGGSGIQISGDSNTLTFIVTGITGSAGPAGASTTASNIGGGSGILSGTVSNDLKLKTLVGGSGIQISGSSTNDYLTLIVTGIGGGGGTTDISNLTGSRNVQFGITIDAGSSTISSGFKGYTRIPRAMNIIGWEIISTSTGTISFDLWKTGFANFPPTISNTIVASSPPSLNNQLTSSTGSVSTWITGCNNGDYIGFTVGTGVSGVSSVNLVVLGIGV